MSAVIQAVAPRPLPLPKPVPEWRSYLMLTKPEVNSLIAVAAFSGFRFGSAGGQGIDLVKMFSTLAGTILVAVGARP